MKSETNYRWQHEFGEEYRVPVELCESQEFEDLSWHNDIGPSFAMREQMETYQDSDEIVRLWVNHPSRACREDWQHKRYIVTADGGDVSAMFQTDDLSEAIAKLREQAK